MRRIKGNSLTAAIIGAAIVALPILSVGIEPAAADNDPYSWFENNWGDSSRSSGWEQPYDRSFARDWESHPPRGYPVLSPNNIAPMQAAIRHYEAIVARGGWRPIPAIQLKVGSRHRAVALLRSRLEVTGDLRQRAGYGTTFDYYVEKALKRFQSRHGITQTGYLDKTTIMALNVPAISRLRQLRTNLQRVGKYAKKGMNRYVMVNIPAAQIEAVENGRVVSRHSAVVGKLDRQTPILSSKIHEINFNPYWTVPKSIVRKDLVPKAREYARRGKDILGYYRFTVFDGRGRELNPRQIDWFSDSIYNYTFRQDPWKENSMGFVKINFHNPHSVYMHDTPSKSLFEKNFRAQSSGCVRVQNVEQLVAWLLRDNAGWGRSRIAIVKRTGKQYDVKLKMRVPVHFVYVTAWATEDGVVNFRRDLYELDGVDIAASSY